MPATEKQLTEMLAEEYEWLRAQLRLSTVPLRIEVRDGAHAYGVDWPKWAPEHLRQGARFLFYREGLLGKLGSVVLPRAIVMVFLQGDLDFVDPNDTVGVRPQDWDPQGRVGYNYWTEWRASLWHEVCHQLQHERGLGWNPNDGRDGHGPSWDKALASMATDLGITAAALRRLIPPGP